jgi:hypothetical protein
VQIDMTGGRLLLKLLLQEFFILSCSHRGVIVAEDEAEVVV